MHRAAVASMLGTNHAETSQDLHRLPSPTPTQQTTEGGLGQLLAVHLMCCNCRTLARSKVDACDWLCDDAASTES